MVPAPLLHRAARPERRQSGGARRARADRGLLGTAGPRRLPGGRRALPDRAGRAPGGGDRGPLRAAGGPARLPRPPARRRHPAGRGEPAAGPAAGLLRPRRPRARPRLQLPRDAGDVPRARAAGRHAARGSHGPAPRDPRGLPVGDVRAQPRRAHPRPARRRSAEVFAAFGPSEDMQLYGRGLRRRLPTMLAGDQARIRLVYSLAFCCPGRPCSSTGRRSGWARTSTSGPAQRPLADAVVGRAQRRPRRPPTRTVPPADG